MSVGAAIAPEGVPTVGTGTDATTRVLRAVVTCVSRWGLDKVTVEDIARESGISRATIYRLFPGGKTAIVQTATRAEVAASIDDLAEELAGTTSLDEWLVTAVRTGSAMLGEHPALAYMREHDPARLHALLSLDRLGGLFGTTADLLSPSLERFVDRDTARATVVWIARLDVSYFLDPTPGFDPTDVADARRLVESFVLPAFN